MYVLRRQWKESRKEERVRQIVTSLISGCVKRMRWPDMARFVARFTLASLLKGDDARIKRDISVSVSRRLEKPS
jgi:hypothetical protein